MNPQTERRHPAPGQRREDPAHGSAAQRREAYALGRELFMLRIRKSAAAAGIPAFIHSLAGGPAPGTQRFLVIDGGAGRAECAVTESMLEEYAEGSPQVDAEVEAITQRLVRQLKAPHRPVQWRDGGARGPHAPERRARPRTASLATPVWAHF